MDDLSVKLPVTHEIAKPDEGYSRRNSTGKILSLSSGEKIPHYLRASTGSCHDHCKYGTKHEVEVKARSPIKFLRRSLLTKTPSSKYSVESMVFPEKKIASVVKAKHSPDLKALLPDMSNITKEQLLKKSIDSQSSVGSEVLVERKKTSSSKLKLSSSSKSRVFDAPKLMKEEGSSPDKLEVSSKKGSIRPKVKNMPAKHVVSLKPKSLVAKELSSPDTSRGSGARRNSDLKLGQRMENLVKPKSLVSKQMSFPESLGGSNSVRDSDFKIGRKTGTSLKPKPLASKQMPSPESFEGLKSQRNSDFKLGKRVGTSKVAFKKVLTSPRALLSPKPSLRRVATLKSQKNMTVHVVSPLKNRSKIQKAKPKQVSKNEVQEKTLYVIKIESEKNLLESDQNKNCEVESSPPSSSSPSSSNKNCEVEPSPSPSSSMSLSLPISVSPSSLEEEDQESAYTMSETDEDYFSEDNEVDYIENAEALDEVGKGQSRRSEMVCSEDTDGKPLKFRRGKVVDLQFENNSPRRLKFRRGRVLGENQNVKANAQRRSFKKRVVDGDTIDTKPDAEKVVLRRQDVQGKKDEKGLFNNVIEETASKLAETRKSKVKALVGAFETVISLQERKPSANSVA